MDTNEQKRTWQSLGWLVLEHLQRGWLCFDKWAGWLIGLDNSKYQWAVAEHRLQQRELEQEIGRQLTAEDNVRQLMEEGAQAAAGNDSGLSLQQQSADEVGHQELEMTNPTSNTIVR